MKRPKAGAFFVYGGMMINVLLERLLCRMQEAVPPGYDEYERQGLRAQAIWRLEELIEILEQLVSRDTPVEESPVVTAMRIRHALSGIHSYEVKKLSLRIVELLDQLQ